jgi:hypothetical protein
MRPLTAAVRGWRRLRLTRARYPRTRQVDSVDDLPTTPPPRTVFFVGASSRPKWLALDCPCGRGHQILLSLQVTHRPRWTLTVRDNVATVAPSIDRRDGAHRCHFWLEQGRVRWV